MIIHDNYKLVARSNTEYMSWFIFVVSLNFISLCFKLIIIHYHTQKQRETKFKPSRDKIEPQHKHDRAYYFATCFTPLNKFSLYIRNVH